MSMIYLINSSPIVWLFLLLFMFIGSNFWYFILTGALRLKIRYLHVLWITLWGMVSVFMGFILGLLSFDRLYENQARTMKWAMLPLSVINARDRWAIIAMMAGCMLVAAGVIFAGNYLVTLRKTALSRKRKLIMCLALAAALTPYFLTSVGMDSI